MISFKVDPAFVPSLIGRTREGIQKGREEAGGAIGIDFPGERNAGIVKLRGDEEIIAKVKAQILGLEERYQNLNVKVKIRPGSIGQLLGRGGETIRKIQADTITNIDLPRARKDGRPSTLPKDTVSAGRIRRASPAAIEAIQELASA